MKSNQKLSLVPPRLPPEGSVTFKNFELESDADYASINVADLEITEQTIKESVIDGVRFSRVAMNGTELFKCQLRDTRFENCNLANTVLKACKLSQSQFASCKFTGFRLVDGRLSNVLFEKCAGKFAQLNGSVFRKVIFQECSLPGADFSNCNFEETIFLNCDLTEAIFYDAKLQGTDFRSSTLVGMKAFAKDLSGAIISEQQALELAVQLANLLGLDLRTD